jgi:UDP-N-acetyl-D-glucosamine 4,6-dehydratase
LIQKENITAAIITKEYTPKELDVLFEELNKLGVTHIKLSKLLGEKHEKLQNISIEDLLARKPKDLDSTVIESFIKDKTIMITGAGGSIGSEIVRQCDRFGAKKLYLLDHSEYNLYQINEQVLHTPTETLMQSVVDKKLLEKSFKKHRPEIVIHAAAYKHVPLCEENVEGAVLNNIIGTKNVIDLAIEYEVERFVFISTDKAVRPTNVMGATKRVCELYAQNVESHSTSITAVRFGNVLGSSGSVIPKFKQQIEQNQPLSVTHPDITRFFMLIPEACQLVLQAAAIAKNHELFVLDMGEPIKIVDLANKMLKLYAKEDLGIEFTGLRAGEKLYEELLLDENDKKTIYNSIFVASPTRYEIDRLNKDIELLLQSVQKIDALKKIIPEFEHKM